MFLLCLLLLKKKIKTAATVRNVKNYIRMLSQIKMTAASYATNVESVGDLESLLSSLETEVQAEANELSSEILILLLERWDNEIVQLRIQGLLTMDTLLGHYVRMKISLHHLNRRYERDWYYDLQKQHEVEARVVALKNKTKEARREYYVAKRRHEGGHRNGCSCRGCRCIEGIVPGSSR